MKFWSDVHFNHQRIIEFCPTTRPFKNIDEMNAAIIERWNARVGVNEEMYFLGDFGFGKEPEQFFYRLNGRKHLITGNHDEHRKAVMALPWASISHYRVVRENGRKFILSHYPFESWQDMHHGSIHLHGHCHGSMQHKINHRFDVGFDCYPSGPVSSDEMSSLADSQAFESVDHHRVREV